MEYADGLLSKMLEGWSVWSGLDTPLTVVTTRAPALLKMYTAYSVYKDREALLCMGATSLPAISLI